MRKIILALLLLCILVYPHPGGIDSNGGHYNRSTGEYHYHHGYPEHQHKNGICPYEFDDNTEYKTEVSKNSYSNVSKNNVTNHSFSSIIKKVDTNILGLILLAFLFFGPSLIAGIIDKIKKKR